MANYGFIGSGLMGNPMAMNLIKAGHQLTVYNRDASKCQNLIEAGATQVSTPLEVVAAADVTFCMVADPEAAMAVCFSPHGVIQGVGPGKGYVDMSTVDPQTAEKIGISVQARGGEYLEAPVSGTVQPARDGELIIMTAGDEALLEKAQPGFDAMGKKTVFLGEIGAAASMKLTVNMMMGSMIAALSEGLTLAQASGLEGEALLDVLSAGALACPMFKGKGAAMLAKNFTANFPLKHLQKDLRLAVQLGDHHRVPLANAAASNEMAKRGCQMGFADEDMCAMIKTVQSPQKK
ncbi:NAD(P)-dependent oxidoreductase [uncultured Desulfuromonas sp.]|uniref:NAD(P)-dependent oxidoreductase n=1 Tax=uncultured Desulfuromonas sp. TaxID=181013 RepID=UPI002AAAD9D4|nr:NAD(P)-dependent oxidoreductase [uncultured Desulfuromonas sp.]